MDENTGEKLIFSVPEVGKLLGVCRQTAYQLAKTNQIPVIRLGRRIVVPRSAFKEWLRTAGKLPILAAAD